MDLGSYADEESGGVGFWMDVAVARGQMERQWNNAEKEWAYKMTDAGKERVEAMLRDNPS